MRLPKLKTAMWWDTFLADWFPNNRELARYRYLDWDHRGTRAVEQPPGTCLVLPKAVVDRVGPMDARLWLFFNDVDWAVRIRKAGLELWYLDEAEVVHHLGASTKRYTDFGAEWHRNRIAYYRKHWGITGAALSKTVLVYAASVRASASARRSEAGARPGRTAASSSRASAASWCGEASSR